MVIRVLVAGLLILGVMLAVKDGRVLRATGLVSSCLVLQHGVDGSQLEACRSGRLQARPDLSSRGCVDAGLVGIYEYWHCPAAG